MGSAVKQKVLFFGHDGGLLASRQLLLVKAGYEASSVMRMADFRQTLLLGSFNLIVICQTLSLEEAVAASEFATEHATHTRQLFLFFRSGQGASHRNHVSLDCAEGPGAFVRTVQRMLGGDRFHGVDTQGSSPDGATL